MNYKEAKKKLLAAQELLLEPSTSFEKFSAVRSLLYGVNSRLDEMLHGLDARVGELQKVVGGDFFSLSLDALPETTEEEKKRKKLLIGFWSNWNRLQGEVARVQTELDAAQNSGDSTSLATHLSRIFNFAKGPLGVLTLAAVVIAGIMQTVSAEITITNQGCGTMVPSSTLPMWLPGLSFPSQPIVSGASGIARIPPLTYTIDGTKSGVIIAKALTFSLSFELGSVDDVQLDSDSLVGKMTSFPTFGAKQHTLTFICK